MKRERRPDSTLEDARKRALRLLAVEPRTTSELRNRLRQAEIPDTEVETVIQEMSRLGYLDDRVYAAGRARSLLENGKNGPRGVDAKLRAKGVAPEVAARAVEEAMSTISEDELARSALRGRTYGPRASAKDNARSARFLVARGFSGAVVARVLQLPDDIDASGE